MSSCTGHSHDHDHEDSGVSLRGLIDDPNAYCLNESVPKSGASVLKYYSDRFKTEPYLISQKSTDPDEENPVEMLLFVPFTEAVAIHSICICGNSSLARATAPPFHVKIFVNRIDLDFDMARELEPTMKLELVPPEHCIAEQATLDYPLRLAGRFQACSSITLYFADNYSVPQNSTSGASMEDVESILSTEINYIGFKGKGTNMKRVAVETVYETMGMKQHHQVPDGDLGARHGFLS